MPDTQALEYKIKYIITLLKESRIGEHTSKCVVVIMIVTLTLLMGGLHCAEVFHILILFEIITILSGRSCFSKLIKNYRLFYSSSIILIIWREYYMKIISDHNTGTCGRFYIHHFLGMPFVLCGKDREAGIFKNLNFPPYHAPSILYMI